MRTIFVSSLALAALAGGSFAEPASAEPAGPGAGTILLSASQMEMVTAGGAVAVSTAVALAAGFGSTLTTTFTQTSVISRPNNDRADGSAKSLAVCACFAGLTSALSSSLSFADGGDGSGATTSVTSTASAGGVNPVSLTSATTLAIGNSPIDVVISKGKASASGSDFHVASVSINNSGDGNILVDFTHIVSRSNSTTSFAIGVGVLVSKVAPIP